jgi:hypothetical protein
MKVKFNLKRSLRSAFSAFWIFILELLVYHNFGGTDNGYFDV